MVSSQTSASVCRTNEIAKVNKVLRPHVSILFGNSLSADLFSGKIRRLIGTAEFCNEQTSAFSHSLYGCLGFSHIFFSAAKRPEK